MIAGPWHLFFVTFLVSWVAGLVGFMMAYLLSTTHAGRQGAKCGLGVLAIHVGCYLYMLSSSSTEGSRSGRAPGWLAYVFVFLGWILIVVAILDFFKVYRKRSAILSGLPAPVSSAQ